jgi:hypothetical protein
LNQRLPEGYFAEANVQFGIEIDEATFEEPLAAVRSGSNDWIPPIPTKTFPLPIVTDTVEVLVSSKSGGPTLAGAIELVNPANKDRESHRDAFVSKSVAYLQQGVGLVVVDIVTDRQADLHVDLLKRLSSPIATPFAGELYAAAYRPVIREEEPSLDIWHEVLAVGLSLPTMPLWLPGAICLPVDLDATYERACREQRIIVER